MTQMIDIYNLIIRYNDEHDDIIIDTGDNIQFSAMQIAKLLLYKDPKKTVKRRIDKDKKQYRYNDKISGLSKKIDVQTLFINEAGLYDLIIKSRLKEAKKFKHWITHEVIPEIRKFGMYKLSTELYDEVDTLNKKIIILEKNQIKEKFPLGGIIYAMQPNLDENLIRIGISDDMNIRINNYDTSFPNRPNIIYWEPIKNPVQVEKCLISALYNYRYRGKKDFYKCEPQTIINEITNCIKFLPEATKKLSRMKTNNLFKNLDTNKEYLFSLHSHIDQYNDAQMGGNDKSLVKRNEHSYAKNKSAYTNLLKIIQNNVNSKLKIHTNILINRENQEHM